MDIYSTKFALIIFIALAGILVFQLMSNDSSKPKIDFETCEIYVEDHQFGGKKYIDEFDEKCLELKNLNP